MPEIEVLEAAETEFREALRRWVAGEITRAELGDAEKRYLAAKEQSLRRTLPSRGSASGASAAAAQVSVARAD